MLARVRVRVMALNTTFNNISVISWRSVLLVEETRVPSENHLYKTKLVKTPAGIRGRRGHDRMVVGFISTFAFSSYHH
jgi:hypothetical protein